MSKDKQDKNAAIDSNGDIVGWNNESEESTTAVHLLLEPHWTNPSRCFFFKNPKNASIAFDNLYSRFYHQVQRIELCRVEQRSLRC